MRVLLVAAGRRVSLAERFIRHGFDVYSYETDPHAPIGKVAEVLEGRMWGDPDARQHLVDTINQIQPNLILPLADKATSILSSIPYKGVVTASGRTNAICLDKLKFEERFIGRDYYPTPLPGDTVILKPIQGANSKGLIRNVSFQDYITDKYGVSKTHVSQKQILSDFEISVDAYFNRFSKMIDAVPRRRDEVQGGEVSRSTTLDYDAFGVSTLTKEIGEEIGLVGPVCAQYIIDNNKPYIMEINSRFGGGVILSMEAGFDQIKLLKEEWVEGKPCLPQPHNWKVGFSMTRYFKEHFHGGIDG